ncbi:slit homolog 2 protein-like [Littorina saxatilis]|uniref:TIR domain-containing protein n=1 Tax=Littorina saxatilis TaxID=31220 RepID=A0AAN9G7K2_9CAEN
MTTRYSLFLSALLMTSLLMTLPLTNAHGDDVCMECPCGPGSCSGLESTCCFRYTSSTLATLRVSVDCSHPGHSHIIDTIGQPYDVSVSNCSGFHVLHENSCLTAMPTNLCHYVATRAISLSHNALEDFPDLQCLVKLGKLDLRHNKIKLVPHEAFRGLKYLREVYLDNNEISYIHPKTFDVDLMELNVFSVSYNRLKAIEAWPMALHYQFCHFNFSHNLVSDFSNAGHWKLNLSFSEEYGPGFVDFSYNRFVEGPPKVVKKLGIDNLAEAAKFMRWGFDFRHNPFHCDCQFYELVYWGQKLRKVLWRDYFNATCNTPAKFHGVPIVDLPLDELVCPVKKHCPPGCHCEDRPAENHVVIGCDGAGMTSLPQVMPKGHHLVLDLANNLIHRLPPWDYLSRAKKVDLRHNDLSCIEENSPRLLKNAEVVDLTHNDLSQLPATIQALETRVVRLDLHTLKCSCDLEWFPMWLAHGQGHQLKGITCTKDDGGRVLLLTATRDDLGCNRHPDVHTPYHAALIATLVVVVGVALLLVIFRYEVVLVAHRCSAAQAARRQKNHFPALLSSQRFDVFISMNGDSEEDVKWVREILLPALERHGLSSYLPLRDCLPGSVEMDEAIKRLQDSSAVLVLLSPDYLDSAPCLFQFNRAYSHMVAGGHGRLLLLKLSSVSRRAVREPYLRAMVTLRMFHSVDSEHLDKALATLASAADGGS